jgi:hypothetical protein
MKSLRCPKHLSFAASTDEGSIKLTLSETSFRKERSRASAQEPEATLISIVSKTGGPCISLMSLTMRYFYDSGTSDRGHEGARHFDCARWPAASGQIIARKNNRRASGTDSSAQAGDPLVSGSLRQSGPRSQLGAGSNPITVTRDAALQGISLSRGRASSAHEGGVRQRGGRLQDALAAGSTQPGRQEIGIAYLQEQGMFELDEAPRYAGDLLEREDRYGNVGLEK